MLNQAKDKTNLEDSYKKELEKSKGASMWRRANKHFQEIQEIRKKKSEAGTEKSGLGDFPPLSRITDY